MGVSPAMTIVAGLATLAAAIGSKWRIEPHPEDQHGSAVHILGPDFGAARRQEVARHQRDDRAADQAQPGVAPPDSATRKVMEARRKKLGKKAGVVIETPIRRCVTENFTIEAMRLILKDNPYGVLIRETELTALIYQMDAYKTTKGGDRGDLLKLADGGSHSIDRVGAGATNIGTGALRSLPASRTTRSGRWRRSSRWTACATVHSRQWRRAAAGVAAGARHEAGDAWDRVVRDIASLHREDPVAQLLFATSRTSHGGEGAGVGAAATGEAAHAWRRPPGIQ